MLGNTNVYVNIMKIISTLGYVKKRHTKILKRHQKKYKKMCQKLKCAFFAFMYILYLCFFDV